MDNSVRYALKVWLTAVLLSPLLIVLYFSLYHFDLDDSLAMLFFGVVIGLCFSFPGMLLLWLISYVLRTRGGLTIPAQKTILTIVGAGATLLSFLLFNHGYSAPFMMVDPISLAYAGVAIGSIWYYKLYTGGELEAMA